jgi:muramidase (phage lysozyme)
MLSNGEFVINAKSTEKHRGLLENINSGGIPKFAEGGLVGNKKSMLAAIENQTSSLMSGIPGISLRLGRKLKARDGGFNLATSEINVPDLNNVDNIEDAYATRLHEIGHAYDNIALGYTPIFNITKDAQKKKNEDLQKMYNLNPIPFEKRATDFALKNTLYPTDTFTAGLQESLATYQRAGRSFAKGGAVSPTAVASSAGRIEFEGKFYSFEEYFALERKRIDENPIDPKSPDFTLQGATTLQWKGISKVIEDQYTNLLSGVPGVRIIRDAALGTGILGEYDPPTGVISIAPHFNKDDEYGTTLHELGHAYDFKQRGILPNVSPVSNPKAYLAHLEYNYRIGKNGYDNVNNESFANRFTYENAIWKTKPIIDHAYWYQKKVLNNALQNQSYSENTDLISATNFIKEHSKLIDGAEALNLLGYFKEFPSGVSPIVRASGGPVWGAGSATSDSIPAMLSNGEFVVNAKATDKHRGLLESINNHQVPKFADGGGVGKYDSRRIDLSDSRTAINLYASTIPQEKLMGAFENLITALEGAKNFRYNQGYGTNTFIGDLSKHPYERGQFKSPDGLSEGTSPAGAFQIVRKTFDDFTKSLHLDGTFSVDNQKAIFQAMVKEVHAEGDIAAGRFTEALEKISPRFSSVPGSSRKGEKTFDDVAKEMKEVAVNVGGIAVDSVQAAGGAISGVAKTLLSELKSILTKLGLGSLVDIVTKFVEKAFGSSSGNKLSGTQQLDLTKTFSDQADLVSSKFFLGPRVVANTDLAKLSTSDTNALASYIDKIDELSNAFREASKKGLAPLAYRIQQDIDSINASASKLIFKDKPFSENEHPVSLRLEQLGKAAPLSEGINVINSYLNPLGKAFSEFNLPNLPKNGISELIGYLDNIELFTKKANEANGLDKKRLQSIADNYVEYLNNFIDTLQDKTNARLTTNNGGRATSLEAAQAGAQGATSFENSVADAFKATLLKGNNKEPFFKNILNSFTTGIVDTFSKSLVNSVFKQFDLTKIFTSISTGQASLGEIIPEDLKKSLYNLFPKKETFNAGKDSQSASITSGISAADFTNKTVPGTDGLYSSDQYTGGYTPARSNIFSPNSKLLGDAKVPPVFENIRVAVEASKSDSNTMFGTLIDAVRELGTSIKEPLGYAPAKADGSDAHILRHQPISVSTDTGTEPLVNAITITGDKTAFQLENLTLTSAASAQDILVATQSGFSSLQGILGLFGGSLGKSVGAIDSIIGIGIKLFKAPSGTSGLNDAAVSSGAALTANAFSGFATGGIIPGNLGAPVPILAHAGEVVLNAAQQNALLYHGGGGKREQVFNINITGDVSRQTRSEIQKMIPQITAGVNNQNIESGYRR